MKTNYFKDSRNGWEACTVVSLTSNQELDISTRKDFKGNLTSRAAVHWLIGSGVRRHAVSFGADGGDFSQQITSTKPARITENVLKAQHENILQLVPQITKAAFAHYAKPGAPKADMFSDTVLQEKSVA